MSVLFSLSLLSLSVDVTGSYLLLVLLLISLPTLYFLYVTREPSNAPPAYHYLTGLVRGDYQFRSSGPLTLVRSGYDNLGDCFRLRVLTKHITFMVGPDANQFVLEAKDDVLSQKEIYSFTVPVFGRNIVYDAPTHIMAQQLKFTNKGLNSNHLEDYTGRIVNEAEIFFAEWEDEGTVDLLEEFSKLIILTASRCLLGEEIRQNVHTRFARLYQTLSDGMNHVSVLWPNAPTQLHRNRDAAREEIRQIFKPIIANRRQKQQNDPDAVKPDDFLQVLIDSKYRDGTYATDEDIVGLLIAALFGGQHTSNITSTWMGLHMVMERNTLIPALLKEQKAVLMGEQDQTLTFAALGKMELLGATMRETLRMYPPLIMLMRTALQPLVYTTKDKQGQQQSYTVPKGDIVTLVPPVSHRLEHVFTNPNTFDPYRFFKRGVTTDNGFTGSENSAVDAAQEDRMKRGFIAFGGGRHGCLGQQFAFLQVKTIWSTLLRQFDFELSEGFKMPPVDYSYIVAGPKPPCIVRYKRKQRGQMFETHSF